MEVQKNKYSKGLKWFVFLSVFFLVVVIGLTSGSDDKKPEQQAVVQSEQASSTAESKQQSQEALDALITLSKEAGVISSYEFSETANVVYVTDSWYNLDVSFKKDLIGKIASLKEAATGYHRFEVRNAKSNEKVAEVTAFSGSIEVYK
jgi:ribosomal protein L17